MTKQGWVLADLSKCHLPVTPLWSRCSPHIVQPILPCPVANNRHETAKRVADLETTSCLRSTADPAKCLFFGRWDERAVEVGTNAGTEVTTLAPLLCLHAAVLSSELEKGRGRTNARVLETVTVQNSCSLFKSPVSGMILKHLKSGLDPRLSTCHTHAQLTNLTYCKYCKISGAYVYPRDF